ncbi:MAG: hypothetical protein ACK45H_01870 [Bacteroidota bacterium]|jgi:hypothetical protein
MESNVKYFEVDQIRFTNFSSEVQLVGTTFQDNMNYSSIIKWDSALMNQLTNWLQRNNPDQEILERMETEILPDDEMHYSIDLQGLDRRLPMDLLLRSERCIQVRA